MTAADRTLRRGDRIEATPCVVTIHGVGHKAALGFCTTCVSDHIIDVAAFETDRGPWKRSDARP